MRPRRLRKNSPSDSKHSALAGKVAEVRSCDKHDLECLAHMGTLLL